MDCSQVRNQLHEALDGELERGAFEEFKSHLRGCDSCSHQAEAIRRLKKLLWIKARREPVPPQLERRVRESIAREVEASRSRSWVRTRTARAAAVILASGVVAWVFLSQLLTTAPPLVHASVVQESLQKADGAAGAPLRDITELNHRVMALFGSNVLCPVLKSPEIELEGWREVAFGGKDRKAVQLRYNCKGKGKVLSCFMILGQVDCEAASHEQQKLGSHAKVLPNGEKICYCTCSHDGRTVLCYRGEGAHFVFVFDRELEEFVFENLDPTGRTIR